MNTTTKQERLQKTASALPGAILGFIMFLGGLAAMLGYISF